MKNIRMGKLWQRNFFPHKEVIDAFHDKCYITTIKKLSFNLAYVRIIGSMECGNTRNDYFQVTSGKNNLNLKKYYAENFSKTTGTEIKIEHWGENRKLSMKVIAVKYVPNWVDSGGNETKPQFHSYIMNGN